MVARVGAALTEVAADGVAPTLVLPIDQYETTDQTNAIIGGYVYRGANIPSLAGWYLYGDNGASRDGKVAAFVWDGEARCGEADRAVVVVGVEMHLLRSLGCKNDYS